MLDSFYFGCRYRAVGIQRLRSIHSLVVAGCGGAILYCFPLSISSSFRFNLVVLRGHVFIGMHVLVPRWRDACLVFLFDFCEILAIGGGCPSQSCTRRYSINVPLLFTVFTFVYGVYLCFRCFPLLSGVYICLGCLPLFTLFTFVQGIYLCFMMFTFVRVAYLCLQCLTKVNTVNKGKHRKKGKHHKPR